jgi:Tol biopolymer transport system component
VRYRLSIVLGTTVSASYDADGDSVPLQLDPSEQAFPSARFLTEGLVQVDALAETLRAILTTSERELKRAPMSVHVMFPASWEPSQLPRLWEALALAEIPAAATLPMDEPPPAASSLPIAADHDQPPVRTEHDQAPVTAAINTPLGSASRRRPGWLGVAVIAVVGGVAAGVIATVGGQPLGTQRSAESASGSATAGQPTAAATASPGPRVALPASAPLAAQQLVVARGRDADTELYVADTSGAVAARKLATTARGRKYWPLLSADRRTIIYLNEAAGNLRTMAADGSGDRALLASPPRGCSRIVRASWSPADQSIMVVQCQVAGRRDGLVVIRLDGTVVRTLATGLQRIEDPMISPDGRTVAYWGNDALGGPNGGSIYTVALDGRSRPVRLTDRPPGSDADPAWSPDGSMIAFRRRIASDNFDVYLMQSDGSGVRPLVSTRAIDEKPAWSPDGRELMILSNRGTSGKPGTTYDGYVVDVAGGLSRPLALTANVVLTSVWSYR